MVEIVLAILLYVSSWSTVTDPPNYQHTWYISGIFCPYTSLRDHLPAGNCARAKLLFLSSDQKHKSTYRHTRDCLVARICIMMSNLIRQLLDSYECVHKHLMALWFWEPRDWQKWRATSFITWWKCSLADLLFYFTVMIDLLKTLVPQCEFRFYIYDRRPFVSPNMTTLTLSNYRRRLTPV